MIKRRASAYYILDADNDPVAVNLMTLAKWFETAERHVAFTRLQPSGIEVSTVFLGEGPPILWETMVFSDYGGEDQWRYTSYAAALAGHNRVVADLVAKHGDQEPTEATDEEPRNQDQ